MTSQKKSTGIETFVNLDEPLCKIVVGQAQKFGQESTMQSARTMKTHWMGHFFYGIYRRRGLQVAQ